MGELLKAAKCNEGAIEDIVQDGFTPTDVLALLFFQFENNVNWMKSTLHLKHRDICALNLYLKLILERVQEAADFSADTVNAALSFVSPSSMSLPLSSSFNTATAQAAYSNFSNEGDSE